MSTILQGFPSWTLEFAKDATPVDLAALDAFVTEVPARGLSDLYVFSHGWNNDRDSALDLYERYLAEMRKIVSDRRIGASIGFAGVIWPSMLWPDDAASAAMDTEAPVMSGGAVSLGDGRAPAIASAGIDDINAALKSAYREPAQQRIVDELTAMLDARESTDAALANFQATLARLLASERDPAALDAASPDTAEGAVGTMPYKDWRRLLDTMGNQLPASGGGGAASLGDALGKLWDGAKDVLRVGTYWQMKERAAVIGAKGLGPLIARLHEQSPGTRIHLLGHSFGARLVSYSLTGLPSALTAAASPVKSLILLQGAFSHFAFADTLPFDASRSGALKGMAARVDGPLIATHSLRDIAVGRAYPAASFVNRDDASALEDQASRWGGMGSDGAQAVNATSLPLGDPGTSYPFEKGRWMNLDGNQVIIHGGLPSGAHSDIVHPQTAWVALAAANLV